MESNVVIVGGGPGGVATALSLLQDGIDSTIIEKAQFPRFQIGESMTGECGASVRALGLEDAMARGNYPIKYGTTVYGRDGKNSFFVPVMGRDDDGNLFEQKTWQVRRSEFDKMLFDVVVEQGVNTVSGEATGVVRDDDGAVTGVTVRTSDGEDMEIRSKVVVDASGQGTFLHYAGVIGPKGRGKYDKQIAIYSHFKGAIRDEGKNRDDTLIFVREKNHWAWFIPVDDEVVSVGVVIPSDYFKSKYESTREFLLREMIEINPELGKRLHDVERVEDVHAMPNYSYHIKDYTGKGYLCIGDSHRFIDPVFSFGLHVSMGEGRLAAQAIKRYLRGETNDQPNPFIEYQQTCDGGGDVVQDVVDAFWDYPLAFARCVQTKYRDDFIDLFAGRVYDPEPSAGLIALRKLNEQTNAHAATA